MDTLQFIPRLWATRKIGYLLTEVRLNGPQQELIDQIVRLSIRYGIVTAIYILFSYRTHAAWGC